MTVSLLEIQVAARAHVAPLAAESAGYLLLAVLDQMAAAPRFVAPEEVELLADGGVRLQARRPGPAPAESPEQGVRRLLASTLDVASSVGPALRRASERSDDTGLVALIRELESALIPVNRSAAKRALSRLHRETERAKAAGKLESAPASGASRPELPLAPRHVSAPTHGSETPLPALPAVVAAPLPVRPKASEPVVTPLTPEPEALLSTQAFTRPEPVVQRAKERGSSTPRLGTIVSAQTRVDEDAGLTERAPCVLVEQEPPDPEPSRLPDVLTAMLELHTGVSADEAPTRLRDVVTEPRSPSPTPEPQLVQDSWLTQSSIDAVAVAPRDLEPERIDTSVHEAVTWNPGPVLFAPPTPASRPLPKAAGSTPPPALPTRCSDVSELADAFHVSGGAEERLLRSALKEMAGLDPTPMPHPLLEEG